MNVKCSKYLSVNKIKEAVTVFNSSSFAIHSLVHDIKESKLWEQPKTKVGRITPTIKLVWGAHTPNSFEREIYFSIYQDPRTLEESKLRLWYENIYNSERLRSQIRFEQRLLESRQNTVENELKERYSLKFADLPTKEESLGSWLARDMY